ncbi:MAG: Flp pilus assembly protein CpaB [Candidatus Omnitrophota bacterium]
MGRKEFTALIVAVICGLLAFVIYVKKPAPPRVVVSEGARCVVAAGSLEKDAVLAAEDLAFSAPLKASTNADDLFLQKEDVIGKKLKEAVEKGAPILRSQVEVPVAEAPKVSEESLPIPPGMQAVTLDLNEIVGVTNRVASGQYADIMGDITDMQGKTVLTTLAYSVPIIAVQKNRDEMIQKITLAFLPEEAETVFSAMAKGKIRMSLLSGQGQKPSAEQNQGTMKIIKGVEHKPSVIFLNEDEASRAGKGVPTLLEKALSSVSPKRFSSESETGKTFKGREGAESYGT